MKKQKINFLITLLTLTIILNFAFINTKSYYFVNKENKITSTFTEEEYKSLLYASDGLNVIEITRGMKAEYLYFLPEKSILFIYLLYFISITGLILSYVKTKRNE